MTKNFENKIKRIKNIKIDKKIIGILVMTLMIANAAFSGSIIQVTGTNNNEPVSETNQSSDENYKICLKSRDFIPEEGIISDLSSEAEHVIIQLCDIPNKEERLLLNTLGVELLSYIPNNAYFASIKRDSINNIINTSFVRWIGDIQPNDKLSSVVRYKDFNECAITSDGKVNLIVEFFKDVKLEDAEQSILNHNGLIISQIKSLNALVISIQEYYILKIADEDGVHWIEQVPPLPEEELDQSRPSIGADAVQSSPYNLNGSGVRVLVYDSGNVDNTHDDLGNRVIWGETSANGIRDHATHVAGIIAGNGSINFNMRGIAPAAEIISYDNNGAWQYGNPGDLETEYGESINTFNINIASNSWGTPTGAPNCAWMGDYTISAQLLDAIVDGSLGGKINIIFSAGNDRNDRDCGTDPAWPNYLTNNYECINPPKSAKNIITVGATYSDTDGMTCFSSWGPVDDGRLKPDVVAPGDESTDNPIPCLMGNMINSTVPGNTYDEMAGTSMAAPHVSGSIALMLQDYRNLNGGADPWPSTMKACLIHTAEDLNDATNYYNPGPDYSSGYGKINIQNAIDIIRENACSCNKIIENNISDVNDIDNYTIDVPAGTSELKVTLVWDDFPGDPAVPRALVNDLDIILTDPNGVRHHPWTLNATSPASDAVRDKRDDLNNVEQVYVSPVGVTGTWNITINATELPQPIQNYSLVSSLSMRPEGMSDLEWSIEKGLCWLYHHQDNDGSWNSDVGITSMCALTFMNYGLTEEQPVVADAINWILGSGHVHGDGSIYSSYSYRTYQNSLAILALVAADRANEPDQYTTYIANAANWLNTSQWDEGEGYNSGHDWYGGFGYGSSNRPDLSNTQWALMALAAAGFEDSDPMWAKVLIFTEKCQNPDGGLQYLPWGSLSTAGSYGSMTAAGIWNYKLCGLTNTDSRITDALNWFTNYYTWDENPNMKPDGRRFQYYYYCTIAKALIMMGQTHVVVSGTPHDWYQEMSEKIISLQHDDGHWVNTYTGHGSEGIPNIATGFSLLALETRTLPPGAELWMSIILASHADLHIYDQEGRHTGKIYDEYGDWAGETETDIPGSSYEIINGKQIVNFSMLEAGNYRIELVGTSNGTYNLTVIGKQDGQEVYNESWEGEITDEEVQATDVIVTAMEGALTIFSSPPTVQPVISVEPKEMEINTAPGMTIEETFQVSSKFGDAHGITVHAADMTNMVGDIIGGEHFSFNPNGFTIPENETVTVTMAATIPDDVEPDGEWTYAGKIIIESLDAGTKYIDVTIHLDNTPPVTAKTVGNPKYGPNNEHVTLSTEFNLTATDNISGVDKIFYRIWFDGQWSPISGTGVGVDNNFMEYTSNFTLYGEGKHYIEFYSVDNAGNEEEIHNQTHIVHDWWSMYHHDTCNTGCSLSTIPNYPHVAWKTHLNAKVLSSPAVMYDGKVFVGSMDGKVYCLDADDGGIVWQFLTGGSVRSSPVVVDNGVFVGSTDAKVYCLNTSDGKRIWSYLTGGSVFSSPVVVEDRVFVGSNDGYLYCLNATDGDEVWSYHTGCFVFSSPAVADDRVFVGSGDNNVYCLNATDGDEVWRYTTSGVMFSSPAVLDDKVFIGSSDGNVYCLNAADGDEIWRCATFGAMLSSPSVCEDSVFVVSAGGIMHRLNATDGDMIWTADIGPVSYSSPAVADGKLVVGTLDSRMYCLNTSDGDLVWHYVMGGDVYSSPAVFNGSVFVGCDDGRLYCFGSVDGLPILIENVYAQPEVQEAGGNVNLLCSVYGEDVDVVKVNITRPDGTSMNVSMNLLPDTMYCYTTSGDAVGTYSFVIWAIDEQGNTVVSDEHMFEIVPLPNNPPIADDDTFAVSVDTVLDVEESGVLANDIDPDAGPSNLTCVLDGDVSNGVLGLHDDGSFTYYPNEGFTGSDSFTYQAFDGINASNEATVTIEVSSSDTGDMNGDSAVNGGDVRYLALYICGDPDYTPLYP